MLEKLGVRPFAALPWLVTTAVERGATFLRVSRERLNLCLEFDGRPLDERDLDGQRMEALTLGLLNAARAGARLHSGPWQLEVRGTQWKLSRAKGSLGGTLVMLPEENGLAAELNRYRLAPLMLTLDGTELPPPLLIGGQLAARQLIGPGTRPLRGELGGMIRQECPSPYWGTLCLGQTVFTQLGNSIYLPPLTLVVGGVSVDREEAFGVRGARVVLASDGLRRTVTGDDVVEDDHYRELVALAHREVQSLRDHLREFVESPDCSAAFRTLARPTLS